MPLLPPSAEEKPEITRPLVGHCHLIDEAGAETVLLLCTAPLAVPSVARMVEAVRSSVAFTVPTEAVTAGAVAVVA